MPRGEWSFDTTRTPSEQIVDDLAAALEAVEPHDWRGFLNKRLNSTEPGAPLRLPRDASERLRGGAFALRVRGTELWARLFYVYGQPSEIVLLDGIYKQSNQTPDAAMARAEALAADYARRGTADPYWASKPK